MGVIFCLREFNRRGMQKAHALIAAATLSGILLLLTGHPAYFLTLFASSAYFGWTFAKNRHQQGA